MLRFATLTAVCLSVASCMRPSPKKPEPLTLHSARSIYDATQIAANVLAAGGFELATLDVGAGVVAGKRVRSADAQGRDVVCHAPQGSVVATTEEITFTVNVASRPVSDGSDVLIRSTVRTDYSHVPGALRSMPPSDIDCVSSGAVEKRIADALE